MHRVKILQFGCVLEHPPNNTEAIYRKSLVQKRPDETAKKWKEESSAWNKNSISKDLNEQRFKKPSSLPYQKIHFPLFCFV